MSKTDHDLWKTNCSYYCRKKNVYENSYRITKPGESHIAGGLQELEWASRDELRAEW